MLSVGTKFWRSSASCFRGCTAAIICVNYATWITKNPYEARKVVANMLLIPINKFLRGNYDRPYIIVEVMIVQCTTLLCVSYHAC